MSSDSQSITYEASRALASIENQPDKIHYDHKNAYRSHPYRQLHHQKGLMGTFKVRLLEASDLHRSYWSALALGPVKHLGLSTAHGEVSSFVSLKLEYGMIQSDPKLSPIIVANNNPVWENTQFEFVLRKQRMDGMKVMLSIRVDETATSVENLIPGVPSGDARMIGAGSFDVTELCLGETREGQTIPGIVDAWVDITMKGQEAPDVLQDPLAHPTTKSKISDDRVTGKVRVLVSYEPHGLEPQAKDIVALESFARRNTLTSSCTPLLSPLMPLTVLERRGSYLLAEYVTSNGRKACTRIHRNSVFVIERQNLADAARNLALLPVDVWNATPIGRAINHVTSPIVHAARELSMPVLLSVKLVWVAARTSVLAGFSGAQALGSTFFSEGSAALLTKSDSDPYGRDSNVRFVQL